MNYIKEFNKSRRAERFVASLLASLTLGHITGAYPTSLPLRPNSTFGGTSDTPRTLYAIGLR